ncbi:hypothetical protein ACIRRH_31080 [Kitasatospora sp. NPDC101235]|uniref:hypothetical protein n=1 Tax=Kitasatospora sp. NPDC101235 TaxID=3364101 RepID=UPI0038053644
MKWRRILLVVTAVLAVAVTVGAVAIHRMTTGRLDHGTVFTQASGDLAVKPGELFSIEVFAYREAGDNWTMATPGPDPTVVQATGDEYVDNFGLRDLVRRHGLARHRRPLLLHLPRPEPRPHHHHRARRIPRPRGDGILRRAGSDQTPVHRRRPLRPTGVHRAPDVGDAVHTGSRDRPASWPSGAAAAGPNAHCGHHGGDVHVGGEAEQLGRVRAGLVRSAGRPVDRAALGGWPCWRETRRGPSLLSLRSWILQKREITGEMTHPVPVFVGHTVAAIVPAVLNFVFKPFSFQVDPTVDSDPLNQPVGALPVSRAAPRRTRHVEWKMRKRRNPWALAYLLIGLVCLLIAVAVAADATRVDDLIPIVLGGVPGLVLTVRAPMFGVSFGDAGVKYSGLLNSRSYTWSEIQEVRPAVVSGTLFSSDVPELLLASGKIDQLPMLAGYGWGNTPNRRVEQLVTELEEARLSAPPRHGDHAL